MKTNKEKKIIEWTILAAIIVGILSVPIVEMMGKIAGLIYLALIFALSEIVYWAVESKKKKK